MEVTFQQLGAVDDGLLDYAVVVSRCDGKWVYCRHRDRATWEVPGGHREPGEAILAAARRELWEETGAVDYDLSPVCTYAVGDSYGLLCFAQIRRFGALPGMEIQTRRLFAAEPEDLTYPHIQPHLLRKVQAYLGENGMYHDQTSKPAML